MSEIPHGSGTWDSQPNAARTLDLLDATHLAEAAIEAALPHLPGLHLTTEEIEGVLRKRHAIVCAVFHRENGLCDCGYGPGRDKLGAELERRNG